MPKSKSDNWQTVFAKRWVKYWTEPARPTRSELKFIRSILQKQLKKNADLRVLVLGSTSEYRDMLIALKIRKPVIVDFNVDNYRILSDAMGYKSKYAATERFVEDDWITMKLKEKFDIIMGDAAINVLSKKDCARFLKNIARHLQPGGSFIAKTWVRFSDRPPYTGKQIVKRFRKLIKRADFLRCVTQLFYLVDYDYKREYCRLSKMHERLKDLYSKKEITKKEWDYARMLGSNLTPFKFFCPRQQWLEQAIKKYFKIKQRSYSDFYYSRYHPTYILKLK